MKYLCLIYLDEQAAAQLPAQDYRAVVEECLAYEQQLRELPD